MKEHQCRGQSRIQCDDPVHIFSPGTRAQLTSSHYVVKKLNAYLGEISNTTGFFLEELHLSNLVYAMLLFINCPEFNYQLKKSICHRILIRHVLQFLILLATRQDGFKNRHNVYWLTCMTKDFSLLENFGKFIFLLQCANNRTNHINYELIDSFRWLISGLFQGNYHGMVHF